MTILNYNTSDIFLVSRKIYYMKKGHRMVVGVKHCVYMLLAVG